MWMVVAVLGVILMLFLGVFDPDTEVMRRCPTCGLEACVPIYDGAFRKTGELICQRCGAVTRA